VHNLVHNMCDKGIIFTIRYWWTAMCIPAFCITPSWPPFSISVRLIENRLTVHDLWSRVHRVFWTDRIDLVITVNTSSRFQWNAVLFCSFQSFIVYFLDWSQVICRIKFNTANVKIFSPFKLHRRETTVRQCYLSFSFCHSFFLFFFCPLSLMLRLPHEVAASDQSRS